MDNLSVSELNAKHDEAMELATLAELHKMRHEHEEASIKFRKAYELEKEVADKLVSTTIEPSRSVIHRSAASLAIDCGEYREAEKLIATALAGDPPPSIASQLRELYLQVIPQLHAVGD